MQLRVTRALYLSCALERSRVSHPDPGITPTRTARKGSLKMFKKISLFALAFAFIGLTGCTDDDAVIVDEDADAEVVTPPVDDAVDDMQEGMEDMENDMEAGMEDMENDVEAAGAEMEEEMDEMDN